jgi:hypothetical protein
MPDVTTPMAPAAPAAPPSSAPPAEPKVSMTPPPVEAPAPAPTETTAEPELKFDFGFEGDTPTETLEPGEGIDVSKPFDPALAEKLKDSPELLKAAKQLWYDNREIRNAGFKSGHEVKQFADKVNSLAASLGRADGTKGLDAIQAEAKEWSAVTEGFRNGDEGVTRQWLQDLKPEIAEKTVGYALSHLEKANPGGWARIQAKNFIGELRAQNPRGESVLSSLNRLVQIAKDDESKALLGSIAAQVNELDEIARKAPEAPTNQTSEQEQKLAQREKSIFVRELSGRVMPQIGTAAGRAAKTVLGNRNLAPEAMKTFTTEIQNEYARLSKLDKDFQANAKALLDSGDVDGFEKLTRAQIVRTMPTAARNINRKYSGFSTQEQKERRAESDSKIETAAGGSPTGQKMRYTGKMSPNGGPAEGTIDWATMRAKFGRAKAEEMVFDHTFMAKGDSKNLWYW